jgi:Flp pilus assembly protein TadG
MGEALKSRLRRVLAAVARQGTDFARSNKASSTMMFAVALPALMGAAGIASDYAMFSMKQSALQAAADHAAIAGAQELAVAGTKQSDIEEAARQFAYSSIQNQSKDFSIETKVLPNEKAVSVELTEQWAPFFAHFLNASITPIVVKSKAQLAGETNICVLALEDAGAKAVHMDNNSKLQASGCAVYSNSKNSQGVRLDLDSTMAAALVCSAGGVQSKGGAVTPSATEDCPPLQDPLASRPTPSVGSCSQTQLKLTSGKHVLSPGTYCKGISISGTADVTFNTGSYVITDGKFEVSGTAKITGVNVGFYLTGVNTVLNFVDDATISLTGAKDGALAGLLFFEDRSSPPNRVHRINSTKAEKLTGTIYLSRGSLRIDPNAQVAAKSAFTAIVVQKLLLAEGPELVLNTKYNATNVPFPEGLRATTDVMLAE